MAFTPYRLTKRIGLLTASTTKQVNTYYITDRSLQQYAAVVESFSKLKEGAKVEASFTLACWTNILVSAALIMTSQRYMRFEKC